MDSCLSEDFFLEIARILGKNEFVFERSLGIFGYSWASLCNIWEIFCLRLGKVFVNFGRFRQA